MQKVTKTIDKYGHTYYYNEKGQLHNETGPAYIGADGAVEYWINNKLHRTDGPAIIWPNGAVEYYINDKYIKSLKKFQQLSKSTEEDMTAMILKYGHDGLKVYPTKQK